MIRVRHRGAVPLVAVGLGLGLCLGGCGSTPHSPHPASSPRPVAGCIAAKAVTHATVDATISLQFVPKIVCLQLGGTVTWVNTTSDVDHTSTDEPSLAAKAGDASLPAGAHGWNLKLPAGKSAERTFTKAGVYHYFCIPHETLGMVGEIVVVNGS
ncbi:MAG: cupredoxin domain-containing protein [Candidatus Dormibacteria bacterium]